jgi:high-affinity iron transporter
MLPGFLLSLREGFEAALILGIVLVALQKINRRKMSSIVWSGAIVAALVSVLAAILLYSLGTEFEGRSEEIFEGIFMLMAALLLTWMVFWMRRQAGAFSQELGGNVASAVTLGSSRALFFLAFLAVGREGLELAFFLTISAFSSGAWLIIFGAIAGLSVAALLGILLFTTTRRLSVRNFFLVTNVLLILFAAGLVARGIHEFNEAGLVPAVVENIWDTNHILNEGSTTGSVFVALFGYNGNPSLTEVIVYFCYLLLVWVLFYKAVIPIQRSDHKIETKELS